MLSKIRRMYTCQRCFKIFEKKSKLKRHIDSEFCTDLSNFFEKKIDKKPSVDKRSLVKFICPRCDKRYKQEKSFVKHVKICSNNENEKEKPVIINHITYDNSVVNNVNVVNNINNNFQFNLPGNENIGHIDKETLLEILKNNFPYAIRELMRLTFFNKDVPENNQWCVLYPKEEYGALQYNHKTENIERWITDQIIDNNFENMMYLISPVVDQIMEEKELVVKLNEKQKSNLNLFYNYFGIEKLSKENPSDFKNIKMMAYNNRVIPIDLWKDMKLNY